MYLGEEAAASEQSLHLWKLSALGGVGVKKHLDSQGSEELRAGRRRILGLQNELWLVKDASEWFHVQPTLRIERDVVHPDKLAARVMPEMVLSGLLRIKSRQINLISVHSSGDLVARTSPPWGPTSHGCPTTLNTKPGKEPLAPAWYWMRLTGKPSGGRFVNGQKLSYPTRPFSCVNLPNPQKLKESSTATTALGSRRGRSPGGSNNGRRLSLGTVERTGVP